MLLSPKERIRIAAKSGADPRTVARYFREPERCSQLAQQAIKLALEALGLPDPHAGVQQ